MNLAPCGVASGCGHASRSSRCAVAPMGRTLTLQSGGIVDGGMGACPHLRGRGRSSHEEAAAVRDGRGSPSHQHTVTGRQLYFLLLSAGGRESVTSKPFSRRGGGCRPPRLYKRMYKNKRETTPKTGLRPYILLLVKKSSS